MPFGASGGGGYRIIPVTPDLLQEMLAQAAAATQSANQEAQSAEQEYQTAEQAPPELVNPEAAGIGAGLARLGTTLAGPKGPDYAGINRAVLEKRNTELATQRTQNLTRLRQTYEAAAQRAAKAGDQEAEIKARAAIHKLDTQEAADRQAAQQTFSTNERLAREQFEAGQQKERLGAEAERAAKGKKAASDYIPQIENSIITTNAQDTQGNPIKVVDLSTFNDKDSINAARDYAAQNHMKALPKDDVRQLREIQNARVNVENAFDSIQDRLPQSAISRLAVAPGLQISKVLQNKADVAAWNTWTTDAINTLRANAGGNGLRMTQAEIDLVMSVMPRITDTWAVSKSKLEILNKMFASRELPILSNDWRNARQEANAYARRELAKLLRNPESALGTVTMYKGGKTFDIPQAQVEDAKKHGYTEQP